MRGFFNLGVITTVLPSLNPIQLFAGVKKVRHRARRRLRFVNSAFFPTDFGSQSPLTVHAHSLPLLLCQIYKQSFNN